MGERAFISAPRATSLLLKLQITRFVRQLSGGLRFFQKKSADPKRVATGTKSKQSWLIAIFVAASMFFAFTNIARLSVTNITEAVGTVFVPIKPTSKVGSSASKAGSTAKQTAQKEAAPAAEKRMPLPPAPGFTMAANVLKAIALQALFFVIAIALLTIGNGELIKEDWDLEWLVTLPVRIPTLLFARIVVRAITNPLGLYVLLPYLCVVAWEADHSVAALALGAAAVMPLLFIVATVQTLADTGLRLRFGAAQLRNFQAFLSVIAVLTFFLALSPGTPAKVSFLTDWSLSTPLWLNWLPPGLAIQALSSTTAEVAIRSFALLSAESALFVLAGLAILRYELRAGVIAHGLQESARGTRTKKATSKAAHESPGSSVLTPIQWRELLLLGRDRNFLVQTLIMPVVLVGAQLFFNGGGASFFSSFGMHPESLAAIAFAISAYGLMFSAFQTLNAEGRALWVLYTVPRPLESILRQKATLWSIASLFYPSAIFGFVLATSGLPSAQWLQFPALVLIGVPIFAVIATALGVFACDPLAPTVQRRIKLSYTYLYMMLASTYIYAVYATSFWQRLSLLILTALLALALWQKARDHLPYLLDPAASPPARVSVSDGLIAALLFFVLQGIVTLIRVDNLKNLTGFDILVAFTIAGGTTFAMMRLAFWRIKSRGIPKIIGRGILKGVLLGIAGGAVAAFAAYLYLQFVLPALHFDKVRETVLLANQDIWLLIALAVVAAPLFEEFIFRGLIFGGLRRSLGVGASVLASAAIFAVVHPPASILPVFGLGVMAALVYERSKLLAAPIAAHAAYNALIVGSQSFL